MESFGGGAQEGDGIVSETLNSQNLDSLYIKINHPLNKSQWLAAVVYCENGAVAHTTPVYFIVDGKPTWDHKKAPAIVEKQLEAIQLIEDENEHTIFRDGKAVF